MTKVLRRPSTAEQQTSVALKRTVCPHRVLYAGRDAFDPPTMTWCRVCLLRVTQSGVAIFPAAIIANPPATRHERYGHAYHHRSRLAAKHPRVLLFNKVPKLIAQHGLRFVFSPLQRHTLKQLLNGRYTNFTVQVGSRHQRLVALVEV